MKKIIPKLRVPKIGNIFNPAAEMGEALLSGVSGAFDKVTGTFDTGVGLLKSTLGGIPFLGSTFSSKTYDHTQYDERHYFLIPDTASSEGFSLYIMRCLPRGVPPINDLEKRRLLHLPDENSLPMLEHIVLRETREQASSEAVADNFISQNLDNLINEIDKVEGKVFSGVLLLGAAVALANPLAGAAIAMKAAAPSIGLVLSKYGLKKITETATNLDISNQIKRAEKDIKKQFKSAKTVSVVNPILYHIIHKISLDMWMMESEKFEFQCASLDFSQADILRLTELSKKAISDTLVDSEIDDHLRQVIEIIEGGQQA